MSLERLLSFWRNDPVTAPNFVAWRTLPPRPADLRPIPADLPPPLAEALRRQGIAALYSHQARAWEIVRRGENLVLATGTASGKTLAYNLPVLSGLLADDAARALYLFPTKALTQDQLSSLKSFHSSFTGIPSAIYDGDTPARDRKSIRERARVILTNPDMFHTGILPHHTNWADFLRGLKYVVIDEQHTYRGVFGSHVANVLRRLKRVAAFYGTQLQFILTSATIGNPAELAGRLIEAPVTLVDQDGSGRGERHFLIYNPPVVEPSLGLRASSMQEALRLAGDLLAEGVQAVTFARTRRSVEILLTYLQGISSAGDIPRGTPPISEGGQAGQEGVVRGYRSGYLPSQRREIERGLRDGSVRLVVATNALELGIDIGGLGAALLVGYPGTIASTWQQAGRAGRGDDPAAAVLLASASPLDQFLAHHPDYFFGRSPELGLVNPDHLLILLEHLRCATFELPFAQGEGFGDLPAEQVQEFLQFLVDGHQAHFSDDKFYWMADAYPAAVVGLRSASPERVVLQIQDGDEPQLLGEVDLESAAWMVHPRAVYLHEGQQYYVQELDLERRLAVVIPVGLDYFTEPLRETQIQVQAVADRAAVRGGEKAWGELMVTTRVTGFRKRSWTGRENLGQEPLDLPPSDLQTTGYWLTLAEATVRALSMDGLWTNAPNDYGPEWPGIRERVRERDGYCCQVCGVPEAGRQHAVHHRVPFRTFRDESGHILRQQANRLENLVTLCHECHRKVETNVRVRSGLAGLAYVLGQLAPLFLMCDSGDLGVHSDPQADFAGGAPAVVLFDLIPAGIGFSQKLFELHVDLAIRALELVQDCPCEDGCPSCVGPAGENGMGGKAETLALLRMLVTGEGQPAAP
ncbi:MAG: DEAD/DEAH box helicase [Anaerolineales bacterium]|nr:DEAD/DEAH box helicase [Anaerolineales bacterium]